MNLITIIVIKLYNMTTNNFSNLAYELINDKYSKAKYLGIECIMETKTGYINAPNFCKEAQKTEDTESQKSEDTESQTPEDTESQKTEDTEAQTPDDTEPQKTRGKKRFDNYIANARYINLVNYMKRSPGFQGDLSIRVTTGNNELRGTYIHPDLLLDLASWISPAAYIKASGIVKNFLLREKEEENMRLKVEKSRLEKMFEESDKRREESDKRREESDKRREEAEKRAEQMLLKMTLQNETTHIKLDETKIKLDETKITLDETKITLQRKIDKTKINLRRVEARVDILVEEVVPPAKKVCLHEQFGIMKLNDSEGKREYKVYCVQTRGVLKARASILKEYPKAILIKEVNPNANAKNFLHKLKEKYGTGKKAIINVSYNFIKLKDRVTEKELIEAIDEVVGEAKNFGV
ncbi:KilA-N domain-containing protein [Indivirus ILV1]|uniref:KilA-N domain-containing protein n=1 Tax=Indivirus ILV1 TaxID=1977633 RepID=A0A1V0SEA4_9VIRU|nr:KilA-N domain-containing protein [Indivirus ILV1]